MMTTSNLLRKAYVHIHAGNFQSAIGILESLVSVDPANVEAWEAYMQICTTCEELDLLCERVLQIAEINRIDRESILDYYYFLRQKLESYSSNSGAQKMVVLELVDQFNFTLKDLNSVNPGGQTKFEHGFAWFLGRAIIAPYIALLAIGLNLLFAGNNFGYWILIVLALSVSVGIWKKKFPVVEANRKPPARRAIYPSMDGDDASYHPKLTR